MAADRPSTRSHRVASLAALGALLSLSVLDWLGAGTDTSRAALAFEIFLGLLAVVGASFSSAPLGRRLGWLPTRLGALQIAVLVFGTLALSVAIDAFLGLTEIREHSALPKLEKQIAGARGPSLALALLSLGIAPGIAEELFCRGFLQRGLLPRLGAPAAIALVAIVFGALHVEPIHATSAAVLGAYLGTLSWLAGSVRPAILAHVVNNVAAVLGAAFSVGGPPHALILLGAAGAAVALWGVWRSAGSPPPEGSYDAPSDREGEALSDAGVADAPPPSPPSAKS